jgi:imidazolonepropionase-like amidohydrolase
LLENVHRRPNMDDQDINHPFKLAGMLADKGVLVGLTYVSGMLASARNLPFFAGTVAAYGTDKEDALSMITLNTAKILRIDELTGSLESGKDANIVISTGDILDMRTNNVEYSFIQGREVDLEALQQRLYQKYKEKYEAQK